MNLFKQAKQYTEADVESPVEGTGRLVQLITERGGTESRYVGVAHENGGLYKLANQPRYRGSIMSDLVEATLRNTGTVEVEITREGAVNYVVAGEPSYIGDLADWNGTAYDPTPVKNRVTGEKKARKFLPVTLAKLTVTKNVQLNQNGREVVSVIRRNADDPEALAKVIDFLTIGFPGEFKGSSAEGDLEPVGPIGNFLYEEITEALTPDVQEEEDGQEGQEGQEDSQAQSQEPQAQSQEPQQEDPEPELQGADADPTLEYQP